MSYAESADEQSEDGELRQSPTDARPKNNTMDFRFVFKYFIEVRHSFNTYYSIAYQKMKGIM